jgi:nucleolar protein 15
MKGFFSQFGTVSKLRLARSKKTTRSKGYAYIQFEDPKVAIVVANTMDKYILFGNNLVCRVLKQIEVHSNLFKGAGKLFRKVPWRDIAKKRQNKNRDELEIAKIHTRLRAKDKKKRAKLAAMGIKYEFEGYASSATLKISDVKPAPQKAIVNVDTEKQSEADKNGNMKGTTKAPTKKTTRDPVKKISRQSLANPKSEKVLC